MSWQFLLIHDSPTLSNTAIILVPLSSALWLFTLRGEEEDKWPNTNMSIRHKDEHGKGHNHCGRPILGSITLWSCESHFTVEYERCHNDFYKCKQRKYHRAPVFYKASHVLETEEVPIPYIKHLRESHAWCPLFLFISSASTFKKLQHTLLLISIRLNDSTKSLTRHISHFKIIHSSYTFINPIMCYKPTRKTILDMFSSNNIPSSFSNT